MIAGGVRQPEIKRPYREGWVAVTLWDGQGDVATLVGTWV
jgi:hypothetical protein